MAMNQSSRHYSKKFFTQLLMMCFLGWLVLLAWSITLWLRVGFKQAIDKVSQVSHQQQSVLNYSIPNPLPTHWLKQQTEVALTNVTKLNDMLPNAPLLARDALRILKQVWTLIAITGQLMLIKVMVLLTAMPLFLLTMTAGLVDGLNQRAIRTASLGRESSYLFHQLNRLFKRGVVLLFGIWLSLPIAIKPELMWVPVSLLLSAMVSMTASRFKKYI